MRIIGMFFLLVGVGLLATSVFNSELDTGQMFFRGMAGIFSAILGGVLSIDSLKANR